MTQAHSLPATPVCPHAPVLVAQPDRFTQWMIRIGARSPRWAAPAASLLCIASALGYTIITDPVNTEAGAAPSCLVKLTTGFDCPGCGGTRAAWYLMHGDVASAAQHHLLFVFALPFLLYAYASWAAGAMFNKQLPKLRMSFRTVGIALAAWAVFSVL